MSPKVLALSVMCAMGGSCSAADTRLPCSVNDKIHFGAEGPTHAKPWRTIVAGDGTVRAGMGEPGPARPYSDDATVKRIWRLADRVWHSVPAGTYRKSGSWKYTLELETAGVIRAYVLTPEAPAPELPDSLRELWSALSGMYKW